MWYMALCLYLIMLGPFPEIKNQSEGVFSSAPWRDLLVYPLVCTVFCVCAYGLLHGQA